MIPIEIRIPEAVWTALLDAFAKNEPGVERVCYLDGLRVDETGYPGAAPEAEVRVATTVVVPDAILRPRNYLVPADAVSAAGRHLRTERMIRVAQVHSHGNDWVEHSQTDDDRAYSQRPGAVSIVVPFHSATRPDPAACGVHVRTATGWQRVRPELVIKLIPSVIDHRSARWEATPKPTPSGDIFSRFLTWLKANTRRRDPSA
jgi:hypothetical protein